jgi:predicted amidophosphoribosyltransferase
MQGAFTLRKSAKITGKKIIIVDDVITTGSTIAECGKVLKESGAEKVYALSTAIAGL